MSQLAPSGPSTRRAPCREIPLATAAGLAVLERLGEDDYGRWPRTSDGLPPGSPGDRPERGSRRGACFRTLFSVFFVEEPVRDYRGAARSAAPGFTHRSSGPCSHVVHLPRPYEIAFMSLAHSCEDIDRTVAAAGEAAREVAEGPA